MLSVVDPTFAERALAASGWLLLTAVATVAGLLLWRVLTGLKGSDPFEPANVRRLTATAVLVTAGGLISGVLRGLAELELTMSAETAFLDEGGSSPISNGGHLALTPVLIGLVLVGIALVYRRGAALRQDLDGLV